MVIKMFLNVITQPELSLMEVIQRHLENLKYVLSVL